MLTLDEMKELKKQRGYSNEQISESSGVPIGTVRKVFSGETKHPRYETMQALDKFFGSPYAPNYPGPVYDFYPGKPPVVVKERNFEEEYRYWNGKYTAADLDDLRGAKGWGELIDGVIFNMASPPVSHQYIQAKLLHALMNYVSKNGGDCLVLPPPLDVHIENDDKTVLQPDVLVLCDRSLIRDEKIWGAPDFVIEILSPSTREKDVFYKFNKYLYNGVREYWIVDPEKERVIVYDFMNIKMIGIYTFNDKVPVHIWNGDLEIDFKPIAEQIRQFRGESPDQE